MYVVSVISDKRFATIMLAWLSVVFAILGYAWLRPVAESDYVVAR